MNRSNKKTPRVTKKKTSTDKTRKAEKSVKVIKTVRVEKSTKAAKPARVPKAVKAPKAQKLPKAKRPEVERAGGVVADPANTQDLSSTEDTRSMTPSAALSARTARTASARAPKSLAVDTEVDEELDAEDEDGDEADIDIEVDIEEVVAAAPVVEERRKAVGPPAVIPKNMNLFDYLSQCQPPLDKKIIDIALAQTQVPRDLRDDAAQDIRLVWSTLKPDTKRFKPGQIASYAHRIASNQALRLRRELGSSVRLPGSAFRKRKDGSSYVTPGVLAAPLDWNDLESWFNTHDNNDLPDFVPSGDFSTMPDIGEVSESGEEGSAVDSDEETRRQRLEALERNSNRLSRRQYKVMAHLIAGESFDDIQNRTGIKKGLVLREVSIAAAILGPDVMGTLEVT